MDRERLRALRSAVARGDGAAVVDAVGVDVESEVPQLAGDGLVLAALARVAGAAELAAACAAALRERGWAGDEELAVELDVAAGRRPPSGLKPLGVNLEELAEVLESGLGEGGGLIDLDSGEVWPASAIEYAQDAGDDPPDFDAPGRWLDVPAEGSAGAIGIWSCSSPASPTRTARTGCGSPWTARGRSGDSKTSSPAGRMRRSVGIASRRSGDAGGPASGWPTPAIGPRRAVWAPVADVGLAALSLDRRRPSPDGGGAIPVGLSTSGTGADTLPKPAVPLTSP